MNDHLDVRARLASWPAALFYSSVSDCMELASIGGDESSITSVGFRQEGETGIVARVTTFIRSRMEPRPDGGSPAANLEDSAITQLALLIADETGDVSVVDVLRNSALSGLSGEVHLDGAAVPGLVWRSSGYAAAAFDLEPEGVCVTAVGHDRAIQELRRVSPGDLVEEAGRWRVGRRS